MTFRTARSVGIFILLAVLAVFGVVPSLVVRRIATQESHISQELSQMTELAIFDEACHTASIEYERSLNNPEQDFSPTLVALKNVIQGLKSFEGHFTAKTQNKMEVSKIRELSRAAKMFRMALINHVQEIYYYPDSEVPEKLEHFATEFTLLAPETFPLLMKQAVKQAETARRKMTGLVKNGQIICGWALGIGMIVGCAVAFVLIKSLRTSILELTKGAEEVAKGNLNHKIQVTSKDEVGKLADAFNFMIAGLKKKAQLEDTITKSEHKYRNIVEHSNDGICIVQDSRYQDGLLKYTNEQVPALLGYSEEEIVDEPFMNLVHPKEVRKVKEHYDRFLAGLSEQRYESALKHKAGYRIEAEFNISIAEYDGQEAALIFLRDITERKRAEEALQKAHDQLEQRVEERTAELAKTNDLLKKEVIERKRAQGALQKSETFLQERVEEQTYEIELTQQTSIEALARLAEYHDEDTGEHLKRIQDVVKLLAEYLKYHSKYGQYLLKKEKYIDELVLASLLHDIGKIAVPMEILTKPGKLTDKEFDVIKIHTSIAGEMLEEANRLFIQEFKKDSYLALARDIAYYHHEKWNGRGYPRGPSGESIPLSARIVALADTYDALISRRPYKEPWSHEDAVNEIKKVDGILILVW